MSTFSQHYQHQHFPQQTLFVDPHTLTFAQYGTRREKTPTDSLINHSGLSPIALTNTPPLSRHSSRPPEPPRDQPLDHMLLDNGSSSNSPTSVRTPDGESFEVEMLDSEMSNYYHQTSMSMSSQAHHSSIPAVDSNMFLTSQGTISDLALQTAFTDTLVAQGYQYSQQYAEHSHQTNNAPMTDYQGHDFTPNYTTQPPQHDPWNGQGPSRSSMNPQSGGVIFDPATDSANYAEYLHDGVASWTMLNTDPQFLLSPSEQGAHPQEPFFPAAQNLVHRPQVQIPKPHAQVATQVEMQVTGASPSPDQENFVNYNVNSPFFTESYVTNNQYSPSSPGNSSTGHHMQSPFQTTISPSAASPSSSDGAFHYQQSDSTMMYDSFPAQRFDRSLQPPSSSPAVNFQQPRAQQMTFGATPEPDVSHSRTAMKNIQNAKSGGRALGTHLEPTVAKQAHDMRRITACWHCVLQRDKCGPGDICERCLKRSQRPNADCGLGCVRIKLVDLATYFLPSLVTQMHEDSHLKHFVSQYIHQWHNIELTAYMTCGQHNMPRIPVKVYEFVPRGNELLVQIQYTTDPHTHKRVAIRKRSPALGMVHINHNEEKVYDKYITDIVENHLDAFGELCWMEDDNDFLQKLFKLMTRVKPKNDDEAKLLHEVFRLIVVTFIMSHTLTIAEETKGTILSRMHSYASPTHYVEGFTSPRMTNRQLKYFFSRLQRQIHTNVLNKLQQIFKSSKGCDRWLAAFVAVLGMCMALEDQQQTVHLVMSTRAESDEPGSLGRARDMQDQADHACREIDARVHFVQQIFRWKYNRKHNPLLNPELDWEKESGFGDKSSVDFVRKVAHLVRENTDYLQQQQRVSISSANQTKYSSRLVGQFLLSFWLPNA